MNEQELRERIAKEIESLKEGIKPKSKFFAKYTPVTPEEIIWRAARIAREY